jgi:hypothetical protein
VKGYLVGIIDRSNLRQKNHGKKSWQKNRGRKSAEEKLRQKNRGSKIATTKHGKTSRQSIYERYDNMVVMRYVL